MDSDRINALLQKYWNAETSLDEEQELRTCFAEEKVADSFTEAAKLFRYFESQKKLGIDDTSFDKDIRKKIGGRGKVVSMVQIARIAAGLLVVVAATFFIREEVRKAYPDEPEDTYTDPKVAFEETKKALRMISNSFNKAQKEASKINVFNEAQEKIHSPGAIEKSENENQKKTNI